MVAIDLHPLTPLAANSFDKQSRRLVARVEPCEKCGGRTKDCDPPGWLACLDCGHRWWYAIADPAPPNPTPEQQAYWAETVELIFPLGDEADRPRRILELRKATEEFSNQPFSWLVKNVDGLSVFSFGTMSRSDASWQMARASRRGCKLDIREIK